MFHGMLRLLSEKHLACQNLVEFSELRSTQITQIQVVRKGWGVP